MSEAMVPEVRAMGLRSSADPRGSEEARALVQARLALLGFATLCLSAGFFVFAVIGEVLLDGTDSAIATLVEPRRFLNLAGAVVSAVVWLAARRGRRTAVQVLAIDAVGTVFAVVPYTAMSMEQTGLAGVLMTALTVMLVLMTRALLVPSSAMRTLGISATAGALSFSVALAYHLAGRTRVGGEHDLPHLVVNLLMWLAVSVVVATIASWVLFGLREEVREARRLGQYILLDKIGEGGMGAVYRARHALLRRPTAVKLLPAERSGATAIKRFEREVQLTASLIHPNTITVFDYGHTPDGVFYYAMEYLDGGDLERVMAVSGPMPPERVVHILAQISAGLAEAHEIGLIHRDIKPANILLCGSPAVADLAKLVDFGLVRELDSGASGLTQSDTVLGTPLYLAPEAIAAPDTVDARVDLYALGAVGYYLLTGEHVFEGRTVVEICSHHLRSEPVPPSERLGRKLPEALEELILSCLAKDRAARPASASVLQGLLLACDDVGSWEPDDARAWWAEHRAEVKQGAGALPAVRGQTVDVDARGRADEA